MRSANNVSKSICLIRNIVYKNYLVERGIYLVRREYLICDSNITSRIRNSVMLDTRRAHYEQQ